MNRTMAQVAWMAVAVLGAAALGIVALNRGETVNAAWMVIAAVCVYLIAYRFYSLFISSRVLQLDPTRMTPAVKYNDGLDYVPTNKYRIVRPSLRGDRGRGAAGRAGPGGADGLPARHVVDSRGRRVRGRSAGLRRPVRLDPARRAFARRPREVGNGLRARRDRALRRVRHHGDHPGRARADRRKSAGRIAVGHVHRHRDDAYRDRDGGLHALRAAGPYRRSIDRRLHPAHGRGDLRRHRCCRSGVGAALHLHRRTAYLAADRIRLRRIGAARVAPARAARLPVHLPEGRDQSRPGGRHSDRDARVEDAAAHPLHRWQWARVVGHSVPVPLHHDRLWGRLRFPRADLFGYHAEDARERVAGALHRLWRHVDGVVRRDHGARCRICHRSGRLFRDERPGRDHRHDCCVGGARPSRNGAS